MRQRAQERRGTLAANSRGICSPRCFDKFKFKIWEIILINIEIKICFEHWQSHTFAVIIVCLILFFGHQHRPFKFLLVEFLSKFPQDLFSWVSRRFVRKLLLHCIRLHPNYITLPCQIFPPDYITLQPKKYNFGKLAIFKKI